MKNYVLVFVVATGIHLSSFAQTDMVSIVTQLRQTSVFQECSKFKTNLELQTKNLTSNPTLSDKDRTNLRLAYTEVQEKYDFFLGAVKQSLLDKNKFQSLLKNPDEASQHYMALYQDITEVYNQSYLPVYTKLNQGSKDLPEELIKLGIGVFSSIVSKIKAKKQQKEDDFNAMLPVVNDYFYKNLHLKTWSELDVTGDNQPQTPYPLRGEVVIPAPTVTTVLGSVEFIQTTNGQQTPMYFEKIQGKDIGVVSDNKPSLETKDSFWTSTTTYPMGTRFKIKISNTAFTYFIVLNSDGIKQLHPNIQVRQNSKDIDIIGEESASIGDLVIPTNGSFIIAASKTGEEKSTEDFCILLSRSELIPEETIEKLNAAYGTLSERITQVFGAQRMALNNSSIRQEGSRIIFDATNSTSNVLPLVFKILK